MIAPVTQCKMCGIPTPILTKAGMLVMIASMYVCQKCRETITHDLQICYVCGEDIAVHLDLCYGCWLNDEERSGRDPGLGEM